MNILFNSFLIESIMKYGSSIIECIAFIIVVLFILGIIAYLMIRNEPDRTPIKKSRFLKNRNLTITNLFN